MQLKAHNYFLPGDRRARRPKVVCVRNTRKPQMDTGAS